MTSNFIEDTKLVIWSTKANTSKHIRARGQRGGGTGQGDYDNKCAPYIRDLDNDNMGRSLWWRWDVGQVQGDRWGTQHGRV